MLIVGFMLFFIFALIGFYHRISHQFEKPILRIVVYIVLVISTIVVYRVFMFPPMDYSFTTNWTISILTLFGLIFLPVFKLMTPYRWALALAVLISAVIYCRGTYIQAYFVYCYTTFLFFIISCILTAMIPKRESLLAHLPVFITLALQLYNTVLNIVYRHIALQGGVYQ